MSLRLRPGPAHVDLPLPLSSAIRVKQIGDCCVVNIPTFFRTLSLKRLFQLLPTRCFPPRSQAENSLSFSLSPPFQTPHEHSPLSKTWEVFSESLPFNHSVLVYHILDQHCPKSKNQFWERPAILVCTISPDSIVHVENSSL